MSRPLLTHPGYARLAYEKSIIQREIVFLRRTFVGDELSDPREVLVCDEVFQRDQRVPQEEIQRRIEKLVEESAGLDIELRKFELVSRAPQGNNGQSNNPQSKKQKGPGKQHTKGG